MQPRRTSAFEAAMQSIVGAPIGFVVTFIVGLFHLEPLAMAISITSSMFLASTWRGYVIRRRFEKRMLKMTNVSTVLAKRAATHGSFIDNGNNAQALKNLIHDSEGWARATYRQREALDMIASKLARIMSGHPGFADHWVDIAGYASIAIGEEIAEDSPNKC
jgi:hypothetical protein